MIKDKEFKDKLLHRLKITRGHLNKVIEMVENEEYCLDVIHQSHAIQKALKEVDHILLENHLNSCVIDQIKKGKTKTSIDEIMKVLRKSYS